MIHADLIILMIITLIDIIAIDTLATLLNISILLHYFRYFIRIAIDIILADYYTLLIIAIIDIAIDDIHY